MLHHLLKTSYLTRRSERNAVLTRTLSEAFRDRRKGYTNLRILAANEDTLLATKSCDTLHHLGSCYGTRQLLKESYHRQWSRLSLWHRRAYFVLMVPLRIYSLTHTFFTQSTVARQKNQFLTLTA